MYYLHRKMKENGTAVIFYGIMIVVVVWFVLSKGLHMRLIGAILDQMISVSVIVIVVLFQNQIRQALVRLGSRKQWDIIPRFFGQSYLRKEDTTKWIDDVVRACTKMAEEKVGALIVIQRAEDVSPLVDSGCVIDAEVSSRLIEQIFYKNTPLHDGAMVIAHGRIKLAAGVLPVSHNKRIPPELGLRHRSALGLSEQCDARVIVVSEETGDITMCQRGRFYRGLNLAALQKMLLNK